MNSFESRMLEITKRWERYKLSREVSGRKGEESDDEAETPAPQPLSKSEVKNLLLRDRGTKGDKKS